ncbi:MAG: FtsX-like permease family protein, partial [bacterium]
MTGLPADASRPVLGFFVVLLAVSGLVLLIASVNVASMLLARAVARRGEIAVRLALGAAPGRLVRQLLTESVVLFMLGGAGGTLVAVLGARLLEHIDLPVEVPLALDVSPDLRVLAFTLGVAFVTGVVFGLAPALQSARLDLAIGLRGDTAGGGHARARLRTTLMVGQVALSLILLSASGLFIRALDRGRRIDPGFDAANVATAELDVGLSGYDDARSHEFYRTLKARLAALPGVTAVGYGRLLPLTTNTMGTDISVDGYAPTKRETGAAFDILTNFVDDGYFPVIRTPILRGRGILPTDVAGSAPVAVINESFAKALAPSGEAVGRTLRQDGVATTIVGVVRDSRFARLNRDAEPFLFIPFAQHSRTNLQLMVRTAGDPTRVMPDIRREIHALDATVPMPTFTTLSQATSVSLLPQRVAVAVTGVLGLAGLLLAAIGLYGVLAFSAAQRTRELGIRLALGARPGELSRLILGEGVRSVLVGLAIGLVIS